MSGVGAASRPQTRHLESPRKNRSFRASPVLYTPTATTQCARVVASVLAVADDCSDKALIESFTHLPRAENAGSAELLSLRKDRLILAGVSAARSARRP
ncbi:hypothetical protein HMPREF9004_1636 [Schaalia cardiffensis F0333]|uniref:Uncharacterized protein n=1 Tax=Schaalia cardiffensis F0333 TaxID=888050 RepID=N6X1Y1_9ACTO|nr:hypothetical protein HMPREF9004_1636 [Schaalia cardiffensis F0333]